MKTIILAGGLPSTLIEEDERLPKPMAEIGGRPLLWHIMKRYAHCGYNDFVICAGYKGNVIKDYFMNFYIYQSDITVDLRTNEVEVHRKRTEDWQVTVMDTGRDSTVMERLCMAHKIVGDEPVLVSYGDCLSDIDIAAMVELHRKSGRIATFAVAHPTGRNEVLPIDPSGEYRGGSGQGAQDAWVDACCMILEPEAFEGLDQGIGNGGSLMGCVASRGVIQTYRHEGFWSPVETARDKVWLEGLWASGKAPWKVWE